MTDTQLTFTDCKNVREFCEGLLSEPDWREVVDNIAGGIKDFEVDNVRFIHEDAILSVLADELQADEYVLGCFVPGFIADQTGVDPDVIKAMQEAEAFEAVGKLIISLCDMEEFAEAYASADGYGHHFNHYDFSEDELETPAGMYHVFDNH